MSERNSVEAVICIPSHRRPAGLRRTLQSLAEQRTDLNFAVVVIDNDAAGREALAIAEDFFATSGIEGTVAVEAQQGNCHAINAAFGLALRRYPQARYFLMIDDDEAASPEWLDAMVETAKRYGADIVGGPVERVFDGAVDEAIRVHPLFGSIEAPTGPVPIIHGSGNCLITRRVFETLESPQFDLRFNFLGGGDMDFFTRCKRAGFAFAWCAEARITEFVATDRLSARWLMSRSIRTGTINYTMDQKHAEGTAQRLALAVKNAVSLVLSIGRMTRLLVKTGHVLPATHPPLMSIGRIMGALGIVPTPYKSAVRPQQTGPSHAQT
jgi:GT2 family glycosyltransferase